MSELALLSCCGHIGRLDAAVAPVSVLHFAWKEGLWRHPEHLKEMRVDFDKKGGPKMRAEELEENWSRFSYRVTLCWHSLYVFEAMYAMVAEQRAVQEAESGAENGAGGRNAESGAPAGGAAGGASARSIADDAAAKFGKTYAERWHAFWAAAGLEEQEAAAGDWGERPPGLRRAGVVH